MSSIEKEKSMSGLIVAHRHRDNNLFRKKVGRVSGIGKEGDGSFFHRTADPGRRIGSTGVDFFT
jgi:hypothetical protein